MPPAPPVPPVYPTPEAMQPSPAYGSQGWYAEERPGANGTNGFAIAALILGIIPVCGLGVVFGIIALVQIGRRRQKGTAMAIAGIVLTGLWIVGAIVTGVVVAVQTSAHRDSTGAISHGGRIFVNDLRVGDCFKGLDLQHITPATNAVTVDGVPCAQPHQGEVYATFPVSASTYPGVTELDQVAREHCLRLLTPIAPGWISPTTGIIWFRPNPAGWRAGMHDVTCTAISLDLRTGSMRH